MDNIGARGCEAKAGDLAALIAAVEKSAAANKRVASLCRQGIGVGRAIEIHRAIHAMPPLWLEANKAWLAAMDDGDGEPGRHVELLVGMEGSPFKNLGEGGTIPRAGGPAPAAASDPCPRFNVHPEAELSDAEWDAGVAILGPVGQGKSTLFWHLQRQLAAAGEWSLSYDSKGELTSKLPAAALVAPWDARGLPLAIGHDIATPDQAKALAAQWICPKDTLTIDISAIPLCDAVAGAMAALQRAKPLAWGWQDLADKLSGSSDAEFDSFRKLIWPSASEVRKGILDRLPWLGPLAFAWGNPKAGEGLSIRDWMAGQASAPRQIIVQGNGGFPEMANAVAATVISIVGSFASEPGAAAPSPRRRWLLMDEYPSFGRIDYSAVRGHEGLRIVAGAQDIRHAEKFTRENLILQAGTALIAGAAGSPTIEHVRRLVGDRIAVKGWLGVRRERSLEGVGLRGLLGPRDGAVHAIVKRRGAMVPPLLAWPFDGAPEARPHHEKSLWVSDPDSWRAMLANKERDEIAEAISEAPRRMSRSL